MLNNDQTNLSNNYDKLLTKVFYTREAAEKAYNILLNHNYQKDNINILMSNDTRDKYFLNTELPETDLSNKALEGLGAGSAIGGALGGIAAAIAAIGTVLAVPGLGLVIAGPIAAGLAGAGAGGIAGGLAGALIGSGIPGDRAKEYEDAIKAGGVVIGVKPRSESDYTTLENEWAPINR
ncbi:hypothetical protein [Candidatus Tisiphia endosymbiont of Beris chalybata]|uniref:hypothetical protein n=1 Tax=Candidatus Tisiphia endosymbiont of Beris chalybata TaxID=3066262 RepID=UPI00312C8D4A